MKPRVGQLTTHIGNDSQKPLDKKRKDRYNHIMPKRKPTSTNYGTATLRPWQRKDEKRERRQIKRNEKRSAIREGKDQ